MEKELQAVHLKSKRLAVEEVGRAASDVPPS